MSDPYIAEIKIVSFNFAPRGYAQCDGQLLPIAQNQALFSLLGTTFGGDGRVNFALPDLKGRVPVHPNYNTSGITLGQKSGEENHTLNTNELPAHSHQLNASDQGATLPTPDGTYLATLTTTSAYGVANAGNNTMIGNEVTNTGGGQGHNNMQPFLVMNVIIALVGIFPSRN